jgi:hypothetical protein
MARTSEASSPRTWTSRRCRPRLRNRFLCSASAALELGRGFEGGRDRCFGIPEINPEIAKDARGDYLCPAFPRVVITALGATKCRSLSSVSTCGTKLAD